MVAGVTEVKGRPSAKVWIFVALFIALLMLDGWFGWSRSVTGGDALGALQGAVEGHPVAAAMVYLAVSVISSVALAVPGVVFAVVAGTVFGPLLGTLLCWAAMVVGSCLSFLVARYFLKDSLGPRLAKNRLLDRFLFSGAGKSDVFVLAVTRLVPVFPFNLQNLAYGVTDISFGRYAFFSALFILPGTAAYSMGAAGLAEGAKGLSYVAAALVLLGISLVAAAILKKRSGIES